jgi:hypothetical protein
VKTNYSDQKKEAPAVNLEVDLEIGRDPEADVTERKKKASSGARITWKRHDTDKFDIIKFEPSGPGTSFSEPEYGGNGQWVRCTYQPTDSTPGKEFAYTITVKAEEGTEHDTTMKSAAGNGPTERRPVIRN